MQQLFYVSKKDANDGALYFFLSRYARPVKQRTRATREGTRDKKQWEIDLNKKE